MPQQERNIVTNTTITSDAQAARRSMGRVALVFGNAGLALAALSAACGGGSKDNSDQVSAKPDAPAAPAVVRTIETTSTPAPGVKAEAPKPTLAPVTPNNGLETIANLPQEAQQILTSVKFVLDKASAFPDSSGIVLQNFSREWEAKSSTQRGQWSAYRTIYATLRSCYISTCKPEFKPVISAEMSKIEGFMAAKWPDFYQATSNDPNAWLRET